MTSEQTFELPPLRAPTAAAGRFHTIDGRLRAAGYEPGGPNRRTTSDDQLACALAYCPACHHAGMRYHPYVKLTTGRPRYRPFMRCPRCGEVEEF